MRFLCCLLLVWSALLSGCGESEEDAVAPKKLDETFTLDAEAAESIHTVNDQTSHLGTPGGSSQPHHPVVQTRQKAVQSETQTLAELLKPPPEDAIDRLVAPFATTGRPENLDANLALTSFGVGDLEWLVPLQYFLTKYPHALSEGERSGTKTYIVTGTFCGRQVRVNYAFNSGDETLVLVLVTFTGDSGKKHFEATEQVLSKQIGELKRSPAPGFTIQSEGQHYATTVTHNLINALTGVSVEQVMFGKLVGKVPSYDSTNIPRLDLEISESGWGRYNWGLSAAEFQKLHPLAEPKVQQGLSTRRVKMVVAGRYAPVAFGFSNNQLVVISISPTARINDAIFNKHRKLLDGKFGPFTKVATPPGTNVTDQYQGEFGSTGILHMRFRHDKRVGEGITLFDRRMQ